jgi:hypothetical protein
VLFDICKLLHTYLQFAGGTDLLDIFVEAALRQDVKDSVRQTRKVFVDAQQE